MRRAPRVPTSAADLVATHAGGGFRDRYAATGGEDAFDDRFPTQPIAVGTYPVGRVLDGRHARPHRATSPPVSPAYRQPPPYRHHHAAPVVAARHREPARRPARHTTRWTLLGIVAVVVAAAIGAIGLQPFAATPSSAPSAAGARPAPTAVPETGPPQADAAPSQPPPPRSDGRRGERRGALGVADGAVPDGVTVFDDDIPAVANLDPALLAALREAATDAADDGIELVVNSGWRSPEYQEHLLDEAISKYGSKKEAARWVATADTSSHVSGDAVDIGPTAATAWLSKHGDDHGLCQTYRNEPWHYELHPDAVHDGCPPMYADPTHDPRMQQ